MRTAGRTSRPAEGTGLIVPDMTAVRLTDIVRDIEKRPPHGQVRLVVVDGPSGSGKSTLAQRLAHVAEASLIWGDDFLSWPDFIGWWSRFDEQVLRPLSEGHDATYQARDWVGDEFGTGLGEWMTVPWRPIVIAEGVSFARREGPSVAYRIWIEAPDEVCRARGLARDGESHRQLWLDWRRREKAWFESDETKQRADLRLSGAPSEPHDPNTEVVLLE